LKVILCQLADRQACVRIDDLRASARLWTTLDSVAAGGVRRGCIS
jgi:hypothetical protein